MWEANGPQNKNVMALKIFIWFLFYCYTCLRIHLTFMHLNKKIIIMECTKSYSFKSLKKPRFYRPYPLHQCNKINIKLRKNLLTIVLIEGMASIRLDSWNRLESINQFQTSSKSNEFRVVIGKIPVSAEYNWSPVVFFGRVFDFIIGQVF